MCRCGLDGFGARHTVSIPLLVQTSEVLTVITNGVISRSCHKTGERKCHIVRSVRKFFISTDSFLSQQIGIRATETCRAVFIVNVYHEMMLRALHYSFMHPFGPYLGTDLHKAKFYSCYPPRFVQRKDFVQLLLKSALVHVQENTDAPLLAISYDLLQVQGMRIRITFRVKIDTCSRSRLVMFIAIPA